MRPLIASLPFLLAPACVAPGDLGTLQLAEDGPGVVYVVTADSDTTVPVPDAWLAAWPVWATRSRTQARAEFLDACTVAGPAILHGCQKLLFDAAFPVTGGEVAGGGFRVRISRIDGLF